MKLQTIEFGLNFAKYKISLLKIINHNLYIANILYPKPENVPCYFE